MGLGFGGGFRWFLSVLGGFSRWFYAVVGGSRRFCVVQGGLGGSRPILGSF